MLRQKKSIRLQVGRTKIASKKTSSTNTIATNYIWEQVTILKRDEPVGH